MATQFSADLFLDEIFIVIVFPSDGYVTMIGNYDSKGRRHDFGDIIEIDRANIPFESEDSMTQDSKLDLAVIMGWGETAAEALREGRLYFQRLARWHGQDPSEFHLFGHDVSGTQLYEDQ